MSATSRSSATSTGRRRFSRCQKQIIAICYQNHRGPLYNCKSVLPSLTRSPCITLTRNGDKLLGAICLVVPIATVHVRRDCGKDRIMKYPSYSLYQSCCQICPTTVTLMGCSTWDRSLQEPRESFRISSPYPFTKDIELMYFVVKRESSRAMLTGNIR